MKQILALILSLAFLAGCGGTPAATEPPPTQTPWIVVVTSTAALQETSEVQPTASAVQPTATPRATATRAPGTATPNPTQEAMSSLPATSVVTPGPTLEINRVPTEIPLPGTMLYPPPTLLGPTDRQPVSWRTTVLLQWTSVGELGEDEYYHLHLERRPSTPGQEWYGDYVFTKETQFRVEVPFLAPFHPSAEHGDATVYWWVWVVRQTGQDENGKPIGVDISPYSEERTLILDPKP
ncbi:MAG: hypothetical protein EHM56_07820 [Chloroflexi bacterium]|nr:MAG: hypothetical protein EHM56_07820 [Chloroflexota bacterium]